MKKNEENNDIIIDPEMDGAVADIDIQEEESRVQDKITKVKDELTKCRAEKQEYLDGWQRAKADYVNALRRFNEEKATMKGRGIIQSVSAFLPALDSLERAQTGGELPNGFEAIAKQLESAFLTLGVEEIPVQIGDAFDPSHHEAFGQDKTTDSEKDDTISAVLEKGWKVDNVVIRPAKVRVARSS